MIMNKAASNDPNNRMMAEQAVARMNNAMRYKLDGEAKEGLVQALTKVATGNALCFGVNPFRQVPPRWSFSGMLARLVLYIRRGKQAGDNSALADTHIRLKRSGVTGLLVILLIALFIGATESGEPLEIGLQMGRDTIGRTKASGDIIIVSKDDESASRFGGLFWARRYDAQLVDRLQQAGVKRIVFNQIIPDATTAADDNAFVAALDRAKGKVWLSTEAPDSTNVAMSNAAIPYAPFRTRTQQAHTNFYSGMFSHIKQISPNVKVDGNIYPAQAEILSGIKTDAPLIKPNYAIAYKSIPEFSASDILDNKVNPASLAGKTILVVVKSNRIDPAVAIPSQGQAPVFYSFVIAAETLKRGMPVQLGFLIPLALIAAVGLWWVSREARRMRATTIAAGFGVIIALALIGDRLGLHFDIVPALLALGLFVRQEGRHGRVAAALTAHPVSGLPSVSHLSLIKDADPRAVVAVRCERYPYVTQRMERDDEASLALAIAARINIIAPECEVHQGDNGLFVFLAPPGGPVNIEKVAPQLEALFKAAVISIHAPHDLGVAIGINDDLMIGLSYRVSLAIDRAELGAYAPVRLVTG